jgi:hypothetical protein
MQNEEAFAKSIILDSGLVEPSIYNSQNFTFDPTTLVQVLE